MNLRTAQQVTGWQLVTVNCQCLMCAHVCCFICGRLASLLVLNLSQLKVLWSSVTFVSPHAADSLTRHYLLKLVDPHSASEIFDAGWTCVWRAGSAHS